MKEYIKKNFKIITSIIYTLLTIYVFIWGDISAIRDKDPSTAIGIVLSPISLTMVYIFFFNYSKYYSFRNLFTS
jgi:hypothetical protein